MLVVTGATGNVGRPLVRALAAAGEAVTAVSRHAGKAGAVRGVRETAVDLSRPEELKAALDGARAMFLLLTGDLLGAEPGGILDAVRGAGVRRVVLLSSQGVGSGRYPAYWEEAVKAAVPQWTVLRPSGFFSNAFAWAEQVRGAGVVEAPFGDVGLPLVDPADVAEVAAVALREDGHAGETYVVTGPELVTPRRQAAAIGAAVRFVELSAGEAAARMREFMPEAAVAATLGILGDPTPEEQRISPDVERLLGRPARTFAEWTSRNAVAFR